ncbi:MAG: hypothetical protein JO236_11160 [Mycobacterium sp.]|uniref:hypothetical protein n=1 Tax=Mycobacterium sp. TaxID=1785 RepID=UPI001EB9A720|nr:hypothetical protein [Mycobacterium sp.]MBW0018086.1 hypothetical protein [Mycobacterium sp.]
MWWTLSKDAAPADWPYGDGSWSIKIEGDPGIETRIDARTTFDAQQPDVLMTGHTPSTPSLRSSQVPSAC